VTTVGRVKSSPGWRTVCRVGR